MDRKLRAAAAIFWVVGLVVAIVGMNIKTYVGKWMTTIGNITFLLGLLLQGVVWARASRAKSQSAPTPPEQPAPPEEKTQKQSEAEE